MIGIDASAKPTETLDQIFRIASARPTWSNSAGRSPDDDVVLDTRYGGPAYGLPSADTNEAIRLARAAGRHDDRSGL